MQKASVNTTYEGSDGMTDKQFLDQLRSILTIAKKSKSLQEFIKELEDKISKYDQ